MLREFRINAETHFREILIEHWEDGKTFEEARKAAISSPFTKGIDNLKALRILEVAKRDWSRWREKLGPLE